MQAVIHSTSVPTYGEVDQRCDWSKPTWKGEPKRWNEEIGWKKKGKRSLVSLVIFTLITFSFLLVLGAGTGYSWSQWRLGPLVTLGPGLDGWGSHVEPWNRMGWCQICELFNLFQSNARENKNSFFLKTSWILALAICYLLEEKNQLSLDFSPICNYFFRWTNKSFKIWYRISTKFSCVCYMSVIILKWEIHKCAWFFIINVEGKRNNLKSQLIGLL